MDQITMEPKKRIKATSNYYDFFFLSPFFFSLSFVFFARQILCKRTHKLQNNASILANQSINLQMLLKCWRESFPSVEHVENMADIQFRPIVTHFRWFWDGQSDFLFFHSQQHTIKQSYWISFRMKGRLLCDREQWAETIKLDKDHIAND